VELNEILLILGVFLPVFFVAVWQINRLNPTKKGVKAGDSSIEQMYTVYNQQVSDVLKVKDKQIASLSTKLRNYEEETTEEQPQEVAELVKNPQIQELLKQRGINPALMDNPVIQKYIKKYTKGMTIEQVIEIAKQFGILKGNTESETNPLTQSSTYRADWA